MALCRMRSTGVAAALLLTLQTQVVSGQTVFELRELADGVYAAEVVRNPPVYAFANSLIVIGADGVLVVDTQQSPAAARSLIAEIDKLTSAPVRWVVNTHWHGDRINGNQAYAEAFPGVEFIAHETLRDDLHTLGDARRRTELAELPASIEMRRRWLRDGAGPDGTTLTTAEREAVARSVALREAYATELASVAPTEPTRIVRDQLRLAVGHHQVLLMHPGRAHTRGDLVVLLPDLGILAVGDLLEAGLPYFADSYPAGWLHALEQIAELRPSVFVPSHGPVVRDTSLLGEARSLLNVIMQHPVMYPADPETHISHELQKLEQHWKTRYGVSAPTFSATIRQAVERAQLEREAR